MKLTRRAKETAKILVANETLHKHSPETLVLSWGDQTSEKLAWQISFAESTSVDLVVIWT